MSRPGFRMLNYQDVTEQVGTARNTPKHISVKLQPTALGPMWEPYGPWPRFSRDRLRSMTWKPPALQYYKMIIKMIPREFCTHDTVPFSSQNNTVNFTCEMKVIIFKCSSDTYIRAHTHACIHAQIKSPPLRPSMQFGGWLGHIVYGPLTRYVK